MELEAHVQDLMLRGEALVEARNRWIEAANKRSTKNLYGLLLPELYRTQGKAIVEIGRTATSLVRLSPHIPEIYRMRKEGKTI